ncbi:MAG: hypothetical protein ACP5RS_06955 [Thermoplasmata archaeon]
MDGSRISIWGINNLKFVQISFSILIFWIEYKGTKKGIKILVHNVPYTSSCSFLDSKTIENTTNTLEEGWKGEYSKVKRNINIRPPQWSILHNKKGTT